MDFFSIFLFLFLPNCKVQCQVQCISIYWISLGIQKVFKNGIKYTSRKQKVHYFSNYFNYQRSVSPQLLFRWQMYVLLCVLVGPVPRPAHDEVVSLAALSSLGTVLFFNTKRSHSMNIQLVDIASPPNTRITRQRMIKI